LITGVAAVSVDPQILSLPFSDRKKLHEAFTIYPDAGWWPQYPQFLADVRAHTKKGDSIALIVPQLKWDDGYSYAYYRASYFLSGRVVLPVVTPDNGNVHQNVVRAGYVALWRIAPSATRRRVVFEGHDGVLLG